jgi:hypothetical protein
MDCKLCQTFILDYIHHPVHSDSPLSTIFHPKKLLSHKDMLCFWIQRIQALLTHSILQKAKEDTEMDFWIDKQYQVKEELWNSAYMKNLREVNPHISKEIQEFLSCCEECGFLKEQTELYFLENYILPLLRLTVDIHAEHSHPKKSPPPKTTPSTTYTMKEFREEYGNFYD